MNPTDHYIKRSLSKLIQELMTHYPVVIINGARQVGKSTLAQHLFPNYRYVLFDPVIDVYNAKKDPELFLSSHGTPLILDEIQYTPEVVPTIKRRVDHNKKPGQYLLTGSQQWAVMKHLAESLAGRAAIVELEGLSLQEIGAQTFNPSWLELWMSSSDSELISIFSERLTLPKTLPEQIWYGFLPRVQSLPENLVSRYHLDYFRTYLERDVRLFGDVNDITLFERFTRIVAALSAQEINYAQIGRELGVVPQTSKRWLNALKATFQWFEVPAYSNNIIKRVSSRPKGYFADSGMLCFLQQVSSPMALLGHPLYGAIFETAVVSEIRKMSACMDLAPNLYHWRSYSGAEVDLILERDGVFYPIEIKGNSQPKKKSISGITAFRQQHQHLNIGRGLVIAPAENFQPLSRSDWIMPWDTFVAFLQK